MGYNGNIMGYNGNIMGYIYMMGKIYNGNLYSQIMGICSMIS